MTNILTWEFKPIQLPKINANLLSTISFFIICLIAFTAAANIVEAICEDEYKEVTQAEATLGGLVIGLAAAEVLLVLAFLTLNPFVIGPAIIAVDILAIGVIAATDNVAEKWKKYNECIEDNTPSMGSGSCGSGSCGTG